MIHIRLVVPAELTQVVTDLLEAAPEVTNLWRAKGAALKPKGDLISADVAKEGTSAILDRLRALGLAERGSISIETVDASVSSVAIAAELASPGSPADAIVWEEVEGRISESAVLSTSFILFITLATLIGAIGVITGSIVLIIGAMIVGPEYGPLAGICVALIERRPKLAAVSGKALVVGFPLGIVASFVLTLVLKGTGIAPGQLAAGDHELTLFISNPNWYSAIVAALAGVVGMLALVSARSGALIGVLISVTTIPAASNVGVAAAYGDPAQAGGAAGQLAINLIAILASGLVVLSVARWARRRRTRRRSPS